jgi:EmrB/QacA subfamily drug resistance transporter
MSEHPAGPRSGVDPTQRRRWLILAICCTSILMVALDSTIVNIALPAIGRELHTAVSGLQWTVDAYTLILASLLILSGSTGDRLGRRRVFQAGLVLFTLGSLLCSVAPTLGWLIAFRVVQAIGGSMLNPVALSIIRNVFADPRERARAIGLWGATVGVSLGLGPVLGGALVQSTGWRSIFWVNVPVGLAALVLTMRFVPESRAPRARRPDPVGQGLVIVLLSSLTYAIIEAPTSGWLSDQSVALFALSAAALAGLLAYERRRIEPLLELRFFRSIPFSGASAIAVFAFFAFGGFLFLNTLYLQEARGFTALRAGLYTLPIAVMTIVCAPLSGRFVGRYGPRRSLIAGGIGLTLGSALMTHTGANTSLPSLLPAYLIFGIGFGMINPPITNTAVTGMPASQAGVAAAVASTSRQVGQTLGVAIVGSVAATGVRTLGPAAHRGALALSDSGWWIIAGCGLAVLLLGFLSTSRRANATAEHLSEELGEGRAAEAPDLAVGV